jgi:tetratricopeptide (TPR) repeat protein
MRRPWAWRRFPGWRRCRRVAASTLVLVVALIVSASQRAAAGGMPFWEHVAEPARTRCEQPLSEAESVLGAPDAGAAGSAAESKSRAARLARALALVRQALACAPDDFHALVLLAEVNARAARPAATVVALERACPRSPPGPEARSCWFHLGVERSRAGQLAGALAAYERLIELGAADATVHANAAELLMALGRLPEAEERYRAAILLETPATGRIENPRSLTFSLYGLAVAFDRDERPGPAREMMARALALDPRLHQLRAAEQVGGDVFFLPEGDVYYYVGLASEIAGRVDDAEAAFQEFLGRLPRSPWARRAGAHIDALVALERVARGGLGRPASAPAPAPTLRVVASGTVLASGPVPAPLVDAAWRARPHLLDDCLAEAVRSGSLPPRDGFRLALELELDARGVVTEVVVKAPTFVDETFSRCAEAAVRGGLRVPRPRQARPTRARLELLVALASPSA